MENALIVVAKEPVPGQTKTRLCPPLTAESAAEFYRCLLLDTLALMARLQNARQDQWIDRETYDIQDSRECRPKDPCD